MAHSNHIKRFAGKSHAQLGFSRVEEILAEYLRD